MKFTLNWLSCQKIIGINKFEKAKAKAKRYVGGINFTFISVSTVRRQTAVATPKARLDVWHGRATKSIADRINSQRIISTRHLPRLFLGEYA